MSRTDYAANSGSIEVWSNGAPEPANLSAAETYDWELQRPGRYTRQNGITFQRSEITIGQISDGTSKTLCVGEKYLSTTGYSSGWDPADDQSCYTGHDVDVNGYGNAIILPRKDTPVRRWVNFGSAHSSTWNGVRCDGSVESFAYDIDGLVMGRLCGRNEGNNMMAPIANWGTDQ